MIFALAYYVELPLVEMDLLTEWKGRKDRQMVVVAA